MADVAVEACVFSVVLLMVKGVSTLTCYSCSYTEYTPENRGTSEAGHSGCLDPFYADDIATSSCEGSCRKEDTFVDGNMYLRRSCSDQCEGSRGSTSTSEQVITCCGSDLCNSALQIQSTLTGLTVQVISTTLFIYIL